MAWRLKRINTVTKFTYWVVVECVRVFGRLVSIMETPKSNFVPRYKLVRVGCDGEEVIIKKERVSGLMYLY